MPMNREKFERILDEIAAEYPGAEKQVDELKLAMDEGAGLEAEEGMEEDIEALAIDEEEEDLEAPLPVPPRKKLPKPEDEEEDEEEIF